MSALGTGRTVPPRASEHLDHVVGLRPPDHRDRPAAHSHRAHPGQRNTDALHDMTQRGGPVGGHLHHSSPPRGEQEAQLRGCGLGWMDHVPARSSQMVHPHPNPTLTTQRPTLAFFVAEKAAVVVEHFADNHAARHAGCGSRHHTANPGTA